MNSFDLKQYYYECLQTIIKVIIRVIAFKS